MQLQQLRDMLARAVDSEAVNVIQEEYALWEGLAGIRYFDAPLVGCAPADDPIFLRFRDDPAILGPSLRLPEQWLPGAKSVLSLCFPYSQQVRDGNRVSPDEPSGEWLHARVEGDICLMAMCDLVIRRLEEEGYRAMVPTKDPGFQAVRDAARQEQGLPFCASSWSDRHAAYAAGLGTFSLAKHIITEKGACVRLATVITDAYIEPTPRAYTDPYEYCTFCGACAMRCPAQAISMEEKNNVMCAKFVKSTKQLYEPRYGCGKCQLDVPCECSRP